MVTIEELEKVLKEGNALVSRPIIKMAMEEVSNGTPSYIKLDTQISGRATYLLMVMAWIRGYSAALEMTKIHTH